jgi:signal transduction histidine kinase
LKGGGNIIYTQQLAKISRRPYLSLHGPVSEERFGKMPTAAHLLRKIEPVDCGVDCESVLQRFRYDRMLAVVPVVNQTYRPVALIDRKEYIEFFSKLYAREVFGRRNIIDFIKHGDYPCHEPIVVDQHCSISDVARIILKRGMQHMVTGFVVTSEGIYLGVAEGQTLLKSITQRRQDELLRFNAELEMRVNARTAELESANKQLESFSYTIAHDMRAPARAMNGYSAMLLELNEGKLDQKSVEYLRRVIAGSRRMADLIDDLLGLARLSRQEMRRELCNLSEIANDIIHSLSHANPERQVNVTIQPDMNVSADSGLMRSLLDNLLGNAWKYTSKSSAATIEFDASHHDGTTVYRIRDNGAGFDMQYAHKLFEPFQRLHHAKEFEGTGIGLATAKKIVQRHNGRVWIEGALNAGVTASFTIGQST